MREARRANLLDITSTFTLVLSIGWIVSACFHYIHGTYLSEPYPRSTFLFRPEVFGTDLTVILDAISGAGPYSSVHSVYFPFAYVPLYPIAHWSKTSVYWVLFGPFFVSICALFWRVSVGVPTRTRIQLTALMILSYPVLFCFDRGNLEALVFLGVLAAGAAYFRGCNRWAAVIIGLTAAIKGYPILLALVFLKDRDWKSFMLCTVTAAVAALVPLAFFPGGLIVNLFGLLHNLSYFNSAYVLTDDGLRFNSSLFGLLKILFHIRPFDAGYGLYTTAYNLFSVALLAVLAAWAVIKRPASWILGSIVILYFLWVPSVSYDYKLIHLLIVAALLLRFSDSLSARGRRQIPLCLGLLLLPKAYVWITADVSIGVAINALLLPVLGALLIREQNESAVAISPSG